MAEEKIYSIDDFFNPSRELCIEFIRKSEEREKQLAGNTAYDEVHTPELESELLDQATLMLYSKKQSDLTDEERNEFELLVNPSMGFDEMNDIQQDGCIEYARRWVREQSYYCMGRLSMNVNFEAVSKDQIAERLLEVANHDKEMAAKFAEALFEWIQSKPQPVKTGLGSIQYQDGNLVMTYEPEPPLDTTPHEVFHIEDKFAPKNSD